MNPENIVIVGAGPAGLMAGCLLQRLGHTTTILEQKASISEEIRGLILHASSLSLLADLQLLDEILSAGRQLNVLRFYIHHGHEFSFHFEQLNTDHPYYVIIPQPMLEHQLTNTYLSLGGTLCYEHQLTHLHQKTDRVSVTYQTANGQSETLIASYVLGCDGAKSTTRQLLHGTFTAIKPITHYVLTEGNLNTSLPTTEASMYVTKEGALSVLPLPDGRFRVAGPDLSNDKKQSAEERFATTLQTMQLKKHLTFTKISRIADYTVHHRIVDQMDFGRIALAGDAACIHSPAGGMAINRGFQDVLCLTKHLDRLLQKKVEAARPLHAYTEERLPKNKKIMNMTNFTPILEAMRQAKTRSQVDAVHHYGQQLVEKLALMQ